MSLVKSNPNKTPEAIREKQLKKLYGISTKDYDDMLIKQNNRCFICEDKPKINKKLHVDHCHRTQRVRGLLCHSCNSALGGFEKLLPDINLVLEYLNLNLKVVSDD